MKSAKIKLLNTINQTKQNLANFGQKTSTRMKHHPLMSVGAVLAVLLVLLVATQFFPKEEAPTESESTKPLQVETLTIGESYLTSPVSAQVKNKSAVTLVAQSAGPVQKIHLTEGQQVYAGQTIIQQSSTYAGDNSSTIQRQIAEKNAQLSEETLANTARTVSLAREQADLNFDNSEELRRISEQSLGETRRVIDLTEEIVDAIEDELDAELAQPVPNQVTVQTLRGQLTQQLSALNQIRSSVRNLEYSTDTDEAPTELAELAREQVKVSTELQLKSAELARDIAKLQLQAARIAESASRVTAPFAGKVEKIYVNQGEFVNPGTQVAKISGKKSLNVEVLVSGTIAFQVNPEQTATFSIGNTQYQAQITSVSQTPTQNQLYEVFISLPQHVENQLSEGQFLNINLPLYKNAPRTGNLFIPLDAVFVTNTERYVYLNQDGLVKKQVVTTGQVIGEMIEALDGLVDGQQLILDRRVIDGQQIEPLNRQDETQPVQERG